jgi:muramidase (phage lysozyme)
VRFNIKQTSIETKMVENEGTEQQNIQAFLKLLRFCEHKREDGGVYYALYGGGRFTDLSEHPNIRVFDRKDTMKKHPHTPAGAYQITHITWLEAVAKGIVVDFTAISQDKIAIWRISKEKALDAVKNGNIEEASKKLAGRWSSLPGAAQSHITMDAAKKKFAQYQVQYANPSSN